MDVGPCFSLPNSTEFEKEFRRILLPDLFEEFNLVLKCLGDFGPDLPRCVDVIKLYSALQSFSDFVQPSYAKFSRT